METEAVETPTTEAPAAPETDAVSAAPEAPEGKQLTQAQIKALPKEYDDAVVELVIDGKPTQMTVAELRKVKQLEAASNKRFQEAADIQKKVQSFLERGKEVPEELLAKLGIDPDEFAEALLRKRIEEAKLSPEQRQAAEERRQFEEERKAWESNVSERVRHDIDTGITEAFKETQLPKTPFLVARIAAMVNESIKHSQKSGGEPLSFKEAAVKVKTWFREGMRQTLTGLPLEEKLAFLGDDTLKEIQNHLLSQVGAQANTAKPDAEVAPQAKKSQKKVFKSQKEWREFMDSL
jgi:hypothetical protein